MEIPVKWERTLVPSLELMRDGGLDAISVSVQFPETNITETSILHKYRSDFSRGRLEGWLLTRAADAGARNAY